MSHSSGIPVSESLKKAFSFEKRVIKVQIVNEELVEAAFKPISSSNWETDFETVQPMLEKDKPCYILFNQNPDGKEWLIFCYVPDLAKVKDKMIYASTRANLKLGLGNSYFIDDVFGTVPADFSLKGYKFHQEHKKSEAPLTESEMIKKGEVEQPVFMGASSTHVHGIAFPIDTNVTQAVSDLVSGKINYVQLSVNAEKERISLSDKGSLGDISELADKVSTSEPRFHFFNYQHEFEGSNVSSFLYVFSCPDGSKGTTSAPVKLRMLYSSSKANVSDILTSTGTTIAIKLEINLGSDLVEDEIFKQLHPQAAEKSSGFSKPVRPGKGARKLIRGNNTQNN